MTTQDERFDRMIRVIDRWIKFIKVFVNVLLGMYVIYTLVSLSLILGKLWGEGAVP